MQNFALWLLLRGNLGKFGFSDGNLGTASHHILPFEGIYSGLTLSLLGLIAWL